MAKCSRAEGYEDKHEGKVKHQPEPVFEADDVDEIPDV